MEVVHRKIAGGATSKFKSNNSLGSTTLDSASDAETVSDVSICSDTLFATPEETLLFLDFDDTLFPTTEIFTRWSFPTAPESWPDMEVPADKIQALERWAESLLVHLQAACAASCHVVLLSHALPGWIEACLCHFAPAVAEFVRQSQRLRIVYAQRSFQEDRQPRSLMQRSEEGECRDEAVALRTNSKHRAMWREASRFYGRRSGRTWKNVISIGDMPYEADALRDLGLRRQGPPGENLRVKVLTCLQNPSIAQVTMRLLIESSILPVVVRHNANLDVALLGSASDLKTFAERLGMPDLGQVCVPDDVEDLLCSGQIMSIVDELTVLAHQHSL